jgi:T4 RnlA family RNA ligase
MKQLFSNLMALCSLDSAFSFKDHSRDGQRFRIFNYRLASYTDFCKPDALEARGIMFLMDDNEEHNPIRIVCRPPKKFFNLNENPFTLDLNYENIIEYMDKMDGSLISSYMYGKHGYRHLGLKSKASLASEQAMWAEEYLHRPENSQLHLEIYDLSFQGYTVNMEFISPRNQVVVPYQKEELVVLNVRNNETGMTLFKEGVYGHKTLPWVNVRKDIKVDEIPTMKAIEGFVIRFKDDLLVKIKTDEYLTLHKTKDSITIPRRLFECVIMECTDDLRSLFKDDPLSLQRIKEMEDLVIPRYNHMVSAVEAYYEANKALDRKSYAIKAQKEIADFFGLSMNKYLGRLKEADFKEFAVKNYKVFGVPDVDETEIKTEVE